VCNVNIVVIRAQSGGNIAGDSIIVCCFQEEMQASAGQTRRKMRFISWNLAKLDLALWALTQIGDKLPIDVGLFQEFDCKQQSASMATTNGDFHQFFAHSFDDYGTCIYSRPDFTSTDIAMAPRGDYRVKFWKGLVYKATAIALLDSVALFPKGIIVVSFHGYNGSLQGRDPKDLFDHVSEVLRHVEAMDQGRGIPCVFAGDFNTFEREHHIAVDSAMETHGFRKAFGVPYKPGGDRVLDMVYTRNCMARRVPVANPYHDSDHPFMLFDVDKVEDEAARTLPFTARS